MKAKIVKYKANAYIFAVPPVCTALWDTLDWIAWIDHCNGCVNAL